MAKNNKTESFEKTLFKAADKLRKNMDAAEYKHIVLGLIFLKFISDSFEEMYIKLSEGKGDYSGADPEDADEYRAENVFFVPQLARWSYLYSRAKQPTIGTDIDSAMEAIEKENPTLKGILPKVYARPNLDKTALGGLLDLIGNIALGDTASKTKDLLGKVYEYFLGEFALAEGKKGGQFYTPRSVVQILVEMLEPYKGRVFDPCCGSGGMFVMSEKFVQSHQGKIDDISIYGQESNQTTYRLCRMNLAIRGIDGSQVKWNNEGSFLNNAHKDLKADFVIANPPFNDSDWSGELLQNDARWKHGTPPAGNANYAWIQHFLYHLSPTGKAGFVLSKGSLTTKTSNEGEIRKNLIESDLVDCIVNLPAKLFLNTQIPACLWFMNRNKTQKKGEILFIDARNLGHLINRRTLELSNENIQQISQTYHDWKNGNDYADKAGFCKSSTIEDVKKLDYVLTPGRYVGLPDEDEEINFEEKLGQLRSALNDQINEENILNKEILDKLTKIKI
ncbi:MAG: class I SAM-dependent DNA methyltransferase [Patescibacteria group bacterium]